MTSTGILLACIVGICAYCLGRHDGNTDAYSEAVNNQRETDAEVFAYLMADRDERKVIPFSARVQWTNNTPSTGERN